MAEIKERTTFMRTGRPPFTFASIDIVLAQGQRVGGTTYREGVRVDVLIGIGDDDEDIDASYDIATVPVAVVKAKAIKALQDALRELQRWNG